MWWRKPGLWNRSVSFRIREKKVLTASAFFFQTFEKSECGGERKRKPGLWNCGVSSDRQPSSWNAVGPCGASWAQLLWGQLRLARTSQLRLTWAKLKRVNLEKVKRGASSAQLEPLSSNWLELSWKEWNCNSSKLWGKGEQFDWLELSWKEWNCKRMDPVGTAEISSNLWAQTDLS